MAEESPGRDRSTTHESFLQIDRRNVGPRHKERSWFNGYLVLYEQPLEDLRALLQKLVYLGSMRTIPPSIYRAATVPPEDIGMSGEFAAQMLHARRDDVVHYAPPVQVPAQGGRSGAGQDPSPTARECGQ